MSEIINNYKSGKPFNYADVQELHELKKQFCLIQQARFLWR